MHDGDTGEVRDAKALPPSWNLPFGKHYDFYEWHLRYAHPHLSTDFRFRVTRIRNFTTIRREYGEPIPKNTIFHAYHDEYFVLELFPFSSTANASSNRSNIANLFISEKHLTVLSTKIVEGMRRYSGLVAFESPMCQDGGQSLK